MKGWAGTRAKASAFLRRNPCLLCLVIIFAVLGYLLRTYYAWQIVLFDSMYTPESLPCEYVRAESSKKLDIAILVLYDGGLWGNSISEKSVENKKRYAAMHNYELITVDGSGVDRSRPAAWSKIQQIQKHLTEHDYIFFTDADTLFMNFKVRLEELIGDGTKDLIISEDYNGLNTGVFMCRNSAWTRWLLDELWGTPGSLQEHMASHESRNGVKYPFEYEQRAFHYLFQTPVWTGRGLPKYSHPTPFDGKLQSSEDLWKHVYLLPQCALNCYIFHPLSLHGDPQAQWASGNFIVHMAGHKSPNKEDLFKHYFAKSEEFSDGTKEP